MGITYLAWPETKRAAISSAATQDRLIRIHAVVAVDEVSSDRTMCGMAVGTGLTAIEFTKTQPLTRCDGCSDVIESGAFIR
jgi:2-keto-3-deoxy-6-phosphogluconate aldolase